ncbi:Lithostathine-2, partial [Gonioctena quinquepunctata]
YKRALQRTNMYAKLFTFLSFLVLTQTVPVIEYTSSNESLGNVTSNHPTMPLQYYGGKSYYFEVNLRGTRDTGVLFCRNLNMELVSIMDEDESAFVDQTIKSLIGASTGSFWTSGTIYGVWYWMPSLTPITYTNWGTNEPSTFTSRDCLSLVNRSPSYWAASSCNGELYLICKSL